MSSQDFISMGFLVLICLSLSSAHRLLSDTIDDNKPKESISNLPEGSDGGSGSGFGVGQGSGSGAGRGYGVGGSGSGSGRGFGQGQGRGYGDGSGSYGSGFGEGWGQGGGSWDPNYPGYGSPGLPPPDMGFGGYPGSPCSCPCRCNGGWGNLQSYTKTPVLVEHETSDGIVEPIGSHAANEDQAAHQTRSGTFEIAGHLNSQRMMVNQRHQKPVSERNEMEDQKMMNRDNHMVVDDPTN